MNSVINLQLTHGVKKYVTKNLGFLCPLVCDIVAVMAAKRLTLKWLGKLTRNRWFSRHVCRTGANHRCLYPCGALIWTRWDEAVIATRN